MHFARTCYDHLAGKMDVALTDRLVELGFVKESGKDYILNDKGKHKLKGLGVEVEGSAASRRYFARQCLDWSERRHHIAGSLGAALTRRLFELEWIEKLPGGRAVRVTDAGIKGFSEEFGLSGVWLSAGIWKPT